MQQKAATVSFKKSFAVFLCASGIVVMVDAKYCRQVCMQCSSYTYSLYISYIPTTWKIFA